MLALSSISPFSPVAAAADDDAALYRILVDGLGDYAVFAVSPAGKIVSWNAGAQHAFGYTPAEIIGRPLSLIFTADDVNARMPESELREALSGERVDHDRWHVRKDGTQFWGTNSVAPLFDRNQTLIGYSKIVRDTTRSHAALESLTDSEQRLRLLIESVRDYAIFSIALDGTISSWGAGAQAVFGYEQDDIVGSAYARLFADADIAAEIPAAQLRVAFATGSCNDERRMVRSDGTSFVSSGKLRPLARGPGGDLRGFVKVVHDITEREEADQALRHRAQCDALTDLPNRRTFFEHVARAIAAHKRRSANLFAVLFVDLDQFKSVNDRFGHAVADQVLAAPARRLERCVRSADIVARLGGDEFAVLVNDIGSIADADDAAGRIIAELLLPLDIDGHAIRATASVGIALGATRYELPEQIVADADAAMYAAKHAGRSQAARYRPAAAEAASATDMLAELDRALERGEFRIAYQPIVRLPGRTVAGVEALVRWDHPRRGKLEPRIFVPLAEQSDRIVAIDRWVLCAAATQMAAWRANAGAGPHVKLSVNVSGRAFSRDDTLFHLQQTLAQSRLPPACLHLEITETTMVEQSARATELLAAIRALGVEVHIDDFGTGYSSLATLGESRVDALKIDASFVANIALPRGRQLIAAVIALAHTLELATIAEGVETPVQLTLLETLGCDFAQGYYLGRPLESQAAGEALRTAGQAGAARPSART